MSGIPTNIWGPKAWDFLNCVAFSYPEKNVSLTKKNKTKAFFENLGGVLPCPKCGNDYSGLIKKYPIDYNLDNRNDLPRWLYKIHNLVNEKLGIPMDDTPSYEEVKRKYESCDLSSSKTKKEYYLRDMVYILIIIILLIILFRKK